MKRIALLLAAFFCAAATAATLNPVQLLNPAGSTAGQAIVSSGPTTPPAWAAVSVAAPTGTLPIANGGTAATSAAAARTSLGAAATASPLSQFASTTSAQLAGVLSDETGTGLAVFGTSPTLSTPSITGVTNASNAAAGSVGEYLTNTTSGTALTSGGNFNCTSVFLTAGDWDVSASIAMALTGTPVTNYEIVGVNSLSATLGALGTTTAITSPTSAGQTLGMNTPIVRFNVSTSTTVYAVVQANFSGGTLSCSGFIRARRVR